MIDTFNRTIVELKLKSGEFHEKDEVSFNRTIVELKHARKSALWNASIPF